MHNLTATALLLYVIKGNFSTLKHRQDGCLGRGLVRLKADFKEAPFCRKELHISTELMTWSP